jgi:hypothetical protein
MKKKKRCSTGFPNCPKGERERERERERRKKERKKKRELQYVTASGINNFSMWKILLRPSIVASNPCQVGLLCLRV